MNCKTCTAYLEYWHFVGRITASHQCPMTTENISYHHFPVLYAQLHNPMNVVSILLSLSLFFLMEIGVKLVWLDVCVCGADPISVSTSSIHQ